MAELVNGGLDGAFIETAVAENYAISNPDLAVVLDVPYDQAGSAIGVQLDNPVLLELINRASPGHRGRQHGPVRGRGQRALHWRDL